MRDPDEGGGVQCEGFAQGVFELLAVDRLERSDAEGLRELDEVGVVQVRGDEPVAVALLLDALHVAEGAVVEHDDHDGEIVPCRGREFADLIHEAAVAGDGQHLFVGHRSLGAELQTSRTRSNTVKLFQR